MKTYVAIKIDNRAAVKQIENEASSTSTKHGDVKLKYLRNYAKKEAVKPTDECTKTMFADLMKKVLPDPMEDHVHRVHSNRRRAETVTLTTVKNCKKEPDRLLGVAGAKLIYCEGLQCALSENPSNYI